MTRTKKADQAKDAAKKDKPTAQEREAAEKDKDATQERETPEREEDPARERQETPQDTPEPEGGTNTTEDGDATEEPQEEPERDRDSGAPDGAQRSGSDGERKKEPADMELSPQGGSGMEQASSDDIPNPCVYCGPSVRGVARQYTTYQGGITDELRGFIKEHPEARRLIVSTAQFPNLRKRLDTPGPAEAKLYKQVKGQL